ncbi:MAG: 4-(cytidine 5'-diphospho)-2-C-methyl-D-erythritol kinase [Pyrinomonadaceae bacterium]|nr:4-(cytidine 5'-diphospho)-2-C-methyl-D-erythritol kinase [Pyrinomonadaceae bacterium]
MNSYSLTLPSFAKVNWSVRLLGRRPDGYHEVRTILQTISIQDDLEFEVTRDGSIDLTCEQPDIPTDNRNLIVRAANALKQRYHVAEGARIRLVKRIPAQAGLGGGSSNAAVSLLTLAHLWKTSATGAELLDIAARLGADVPFFLLGGVALGTGTGATVSALADDDERRIPHLIVIKPNATVSTAAAYAAMNLPALTTKKQDPILSNSQTSANSEDSQPWPLSDLFLSESQNDFEAVIFDIEPEIRRARDTLLQAGALGALLAGSGSSVFGIFADAEAQQRGIKEIQAEAGWRIFPCVTLSRDEYRRQIGLELFHFFEKGQ